MYNYRDSKYKSLYTYLYYLQLPICSLFQVISCPCRWLWSLTSGCSNLLSLLTVNHWFTTLILSPTTSKHLTTHLSTDVWQLSANTIELCAQNLGFQAENSEQSATLSTGISTLSEEVCLSISTVSPRHTLPAYIKLYTCSFPRDLSFSLRRTSPYLPCKSCQLSQPTHTLIPGWV